MKSNSITNFYFKLHIFVLALIKDLALTELAAPYFFHTTWARFSGTFPAMVQRRV